MRKLLIILFLGFAGVTVNAQQVKKIKITDLEKIITETKVPLVISFWATFCLPCLEEIPHLEKSIKKYNEEKDTPEDIQLFLVSLDLEDYYPKKLTDFVKKRKFISPVLWLDEYNADYFCPKVDSAWSGAIPATLMINNHTGFRKLFEEQLSPEKIEKEIITLVGGKNDSPVNLQKNKKP